MKNIFLTILLFAAVAVNGQTMVMNDETTDITFTTGHLFGKLEGTFKGAKGSVSLDSNNLAGSSLQFSFASSTLLQNDYLVGPNLLRASCFNAGQFPAIELTSTSVTKLPAAKQYQFKGTLTVKGISKEIAFPFTATPNVGGYDLNFTFPIRKKHYNLTCPTTRQFKISVRGYAKKM